MMPETQSDAAPAHHDTRLKLIVDVVIFQFKLAADGLRDVLLIPASITAAIVGLIAGGAEPDRYFRRVLRFGRQSELWINLFGRRHHERGADALVRPLEESLLTQVRAGGRLSGGAKQVNRLLDAVNKRRPPPPETRH
jgi:hypothetical protein